MNMYGSSNKKIKTIIGKYCSTLCHGAIDESCLSSNDELEGGRMTKRSPKRNICIGINYSNF